MKAVLLKRTTHCIAHHYFLALVYFFPTLVCACLSTTALVRVFIVILIRPLAEWASRSNEVAIARPEPLK